MLFWMVTSDSIKVLRSLYILKPVPPPDYSVLRKQVVGVPGAVIKHYLMPYDFIIRHRLGLLNPTNGPSRRPDYMAIA
jgi:hypothetical protein